MTIELKKILVAAKEYERRSMVWFNMYQESHDEFDWRECKELSDKCDTMLEAYEILTGKKIGAPWQDIEPLPDPKPEPNPSPTKSIDDLAVETILGEYGTGAERQRLLGSNYNDVQERVNQYYNRARECIRGDWGNGWNRTNALTGAGYNADIVQRIVNEMMS